MLPSDARAVDVSFTKRELVVRLTDGRTVSVPLTFFPRLLDAKRKERERYELLGEGEGIRWPLIDEDLSVAGLLRGTMSPEAGIKRDARG